jgi:lipoate synthase
LVEVFEEVTFANNCDNAAPYINVRMTVECPHRCVFCQARNGIPSLCDKPDVDAIAKSVLDTGWQHVVIEGGEPLLFVDECLELAKILRPHVKDITMFTSLPVELIQHDQRTAFVDLVNMIDGTNISMLSHNIPTIKALMQIPGHRNTNARFDMIKALVHAQLTDKFRVSTVLVKGYTDNLVHIQSFIRHYETLGVKSFKIGELTHCTRLFVPMSEVLGFEQKSPFAHGCSTRTSFERILALPNTVEQVYGQKREFPNSVLLKRACFLTEHSLKANLQDMIKVVIKEKVLRPLNRADNYMVVYEDGSTSKRWLQNGHD